MKDIVRAAWHGMGPWKWLGIAAILTVIVLTPVTAEGSMSATAGVAPRAVEAGKLRDVDGRALENAAT